MRFMMLVRADENTEAGVLPTRELVDAMMEFNERMIEAGVMLAAEGLQPSSTGVRVTYSDGKPTVIHGPFTQTKELIAGFWLIDVKSKDEAIEWATQVPFRQGEVVELRQVSEVSDFPPEILSPENAEREQAWREEMSQPRGTRGD